MQLDMFGTDEPAATAAPEDPRDAIAARRAAVFAQQPEKLRQGAPVTPRESFLFLVGAIERVAPSREFFEDLAKSALAKLGGMGGEW